MNFVNPAHVKNHNMSIRFPEFSMSITKSHKIEFLDLRKENKDRIQIIAAMIQDTYSRKAERKKLHVWTRDQIAKVIEKYSSCCAILVNHDTNQIDATQTMVPPHVVQGNPFIRFASIGFHTNLLNNKNLLPYALQLHHALMKHLASFNLWAKIPYDDKVLSSLSMKNGYKPVSDSILVNELLHATGYSAETTIHESGIVLVHHPHKKYVEKVILRQREL
ncbi:hypothetical protein SAMN05444487_10330 [Marininema mesophilum]|uniref:Uncharacterized protein n=1 Tax=Marininema mesophilum TaxID=1048340 RepID=A0A1H2T518_9BACL|nr:hypothetical protein [Marininema mesophilum]SDW38962.1 hypothetical protein SAMN05444487_10330 [Marininema mesophilum]